MDFFVQKIFEVIAVFAPRLAGAVVLLIVGFWIIKRLTRLFKLFLLKRRVDTDLRPFLTGIVSVSLKIMLLFSAAGIVGIETTSFVAILASAGLAVGLALQGALQNFAGGVLILLFKPFRTGDYITAQGYSGTVKEIQIFNIIIETDSKEQVFLPNGKLSNEAVVNYTQKGIRCVSVKLPLMHTYAPNEVIEVLKAVTDSYEGLLPGHPVEVTVLDVKDRYVLYEILAWINASDHEAVHEHLLHKAFEALHAKGFYKVPIKIV